MLDLSDFNPSPNDDAPPATDKTNITMHKDWSDSLTQAGASLTSRDDLPFIDFPASAPPFDALAQASVVVPLVHLGLMRCSGEDRSAFLHNLLSNDVKSLGAAAQWTSFNSPKGRMLANLLLWSDHDGHVLALSRDIQPPLQKKLSMYVLRSKVKLADAGDELALLGVAGPQAAAHLQAAGLPAADADTSPNRLGVAIVDDIRVIRLAEQCFVVVAPGERAGELHRGLLAAGSLAAGTDAWALAMIRAGLPRVGSTTQDAFVAQMLNFDLLGGIHFKKGCYPGQEIVARTQYLGKLKQRMYRVALTTPERPQPGGELYAPDFGEQATGRLVNVAPLGDNAYEALAVMRMSSAETGDVHLGSLNGPALRFLDLPYSLP